MKEGESETQQIVQSIQNTTNALHRVSYCSFAASLFLNFVLKVRYLYWAKSTDYADEKSNFTNMMMSV